MTSLNGQGLLSGWGRLPSREFRKSLKYRRVVAAVAWANTAAETLGGGKEEHGEDHWEHSDSHRSGRQVPEGAGSRGGEGHQPRRGCC